MFGLTFTIVLIFTIAGWFVFKDSDSIGWRFLLTLSATGLAYWIMMIAWAACGAVSCLGK